MTVVNGFFVLALIAAYIFFRKYLFSSKKAVLVRAQISRIKLHQIDYLWSPEVEVFYRFRLNDKEFHGRDFLRIDTFTQDLVFLLGTVNGFPVLVTEHEVFSTEEHIETFLLSIIDHVIIEVNEANPGESRVYLDGNEKKQLFENVSVKFPWNMYD